ncbi:MAG: acetolactate synthase [Ruminococcaceae bacterium]|nr:acetolactate synthase [Oscillospiraceae bacterium]
MTLHQLSVFIENKSGRLSEIISILAKSGVDIRALSIADTTDFGILRLIVNDVDLAVSILKENNMAVSKTEVIGIKPKDEIGALANLFALLSENGVDVEYAYAFINHECVVIRVEDNSAAIRVLNQNGYTLASEIE